MYFIFLTSTFSLQNLAADIVYHRPDNPLQFIVEKLEKDKEETNRSSKDANFNQQSSS
jgi:hypothetical protein